MDLKKKGLNKEDLTKIEHVDLNYQLAPGLIMVTIPSIAYMENEFLSGFDYKNEGLDKGQAITMKSQRKEFEEDYLKKADGLLVLGIGKDISGNEWLEVGDTVSFAGHARLQGYDLEMNYVSEDGVEMEKVHVTIARVGDVSMKKKDRL